VNERINVGNGVFTLQGAKAEAFSASFDAISRVEAYKLDEVTADLICFDILVDTERGSVVVFVHEEVEGFDALVTRLESLPGFDRTWRDEIVLPAFEANHAVLFRRALADTQ
jgi:hypothetical protein